MRTHETILAIVATDSTFELLEGQDGRVWVGKCIHCNAHLTVGADGRPISRATIEHILPRTGGGDDSLENLALACARCNHDKGVRHDRRAKTQARSADVVTRLLEKRRQRWRAAPES